MSSTSDSPSLVVVDVRGRWTRGTPFAPRAAYIPPPRKPLRQIDTIQQNGVASIDGIDDPSARAAAGVREEWRVVASRRPPQLPPPHDDTGARSDADSAAHTTLTTPTPRDGATVRTQTQRLVQQSEQHRGLLTLPHGTLSQHRALPTHPHFNSVPLVPPVPTASAPPNKQKAPKPSQRALGSLIDLTSLRQLDAVMAGRKQANASVSHVNARSIASAAPILKRAWDLPRVTTAIGDSAPPIVRPASSKPPRAATHKGSRYVASVSSNTTASITPVSSARPRSASVKSSRPPRPVSSSAVPAALNKRSKPTLLKKQLLKERAQRFEQWMREAVVMPLVHQALGLPPPPASSVFVSDSLSAASDSLPSSHSEREKALAVLSRRIKAETHAANRARHEAQVAQVQADKRARKEAMHALRMEQQQAAKAAKAEKLSAKHREPAVAAEAISDFSCPDSSFDTRLAAVNADTRPNLGAHKDIEISQQLPTRPVEDGHAKNEEFTTSDGSSEDQSEEEFLLAPPLPSTSYMLGHLPSPTPPAASLPVEASSDSAAGSEDSNAGLHLNLLRNHVIPASVQLSTHDHALLRWHFQSVHHGIQPVMVGACRRHCKQMFKPAINQLTSSILKDLHRFQQRMRSKAVDHSGSVSGDTGASKSKATRYFYVSGLKQTLKLTRVGQVRAVFVAANIEQNETAGGLDDMLEEIMDLCEEKRVPIIFALDRSKLGRCLGISNPTSAVAVLDYSGVGDQYRLLLGMVAAAQEEWRMLQEDTLINPRPDGWAAAHERELALMEQRRQERAQAARLHENAFAQAEAERRAHRAAMVEGKSKKSSSGAGKKKKQRGPGGAGGSSRELLPLPVLNEEDTKRGRKKGKHRGAFETTNNASGAGSVTPQLKGAGRALNAIAESMAEGEKKDGSGSGSKTGVVAAATSKLLKKGQTASSESVAVVAAAGSAKHKNKPSRK